MEDTAEVASIKVWLRDYASRRINSVLMDERRCVPPYVVLDMGNRGLMGLSVAREHGGLGLPMAQVVRVLEQLAAIDLTLAIMVGIHNGLGIRPIDRFGAPALRAELLPQLASGRMLGGLSITERVAGSSPRLIETTAEPVPGGYRVTGAKTWVGNGSWAGAINVFARRTAANGGGMIAFSLRTDNPGLRMGPEALTLGMRAIVQNELFLEDAFVPREAILGDEGEGFAVAEDSFALARAGIAAAALGALRRCAQLAHRYAKRRTFTTGPSIDNPKTLEGITWLVCAVHALEELVQATASAMDTAPQPQASALCKILGAELLSTGADRAIQLLGGRGYIETSGLPQLARDARLLRIFEGPTETLEAHLGSAVLLDMLKPAEICAGLFSAPGVLGELEETIGRCKVAAKAAPGRLRAYPKSVAGNIVAWASLAAACEQRHARDRSPTSELALAWALREMRSRATAGLQSLASPHVLDSAALADVVQGYEGRVGDVEQRLPGADYQLDPMLAR